MVRLQEALSVELVQVAPYIPVVQITVKLTVSQLQNRFWSILFFLS